MYDNKNKYYEKKTLVTINSSDRIKQHKLITRLNPNKVEKNGLKIIDNKTILVSHIHNYEITDTTEIIFRNIEGVYNKNLNKNAIGGIPVEYLNYNELTGKPIFNIEYVYNYENNRRVSNSYKIKIPLNINKNLLVLNTSGGGENIIVEKIDEFVRGYEDSSYYKITLPRRFINIKNVKLISLEMSNAQYAIRDLVNKKYNMNEDYISNNNFIHWINKENETKIGSNFLVNNEKILEVMNNNLNDISTKWVKNETTEEILYEYLSEQYLNKINTNLENFQMKFISLLYLLKYRIENPLNSSVLTNDMLNMIKDSNSYLLKFSNNGISHKLFLRDRNNEINTTYDIKYFINDFESKQTLISFVHNFTDYNSTINSYNDDLTTNFDENYIYQTPIPTNIPTEGLNIYNFLRNISEYYIKENATNRLYFKFLNNSEIELEYYYIKYIFLRNIELLIEEIIQYNYKNNDKNKKLEILKNEFMNYLVELNRNIKIPLNEIEKTVIEYGYLISFIYESKTYNLYFNKKPNNTETIINYTIGDFKNVTTLIDFIKKLRIANSTFTLIPSYTNNLYILPNTEYILNNTTIQNIEIYRNIEYIFDISHIDLKNKIIKVTTNTTVILDYNFNNNIIIRDNKIYITISINENINNLYIINTTDSTANVPKIIAEISIQNINKYKNDFSIYGYLHNLSFIKKIEYIHNNKLTNYTYINNSFVTLIKK